VVMEGLAIYSVLSRCFRWLRYVRIIRHRIMLHSIFIRYLGWFGRNIDMAEVGDSSSPGPTIISMTYTLPRKSLAKFWQYFGKTERLIQQCSAFFVFGHIENKSNRNRKRMMQDWADYVYSLGDGAKVVPIRAKGVAL